MAKREKTAMPLAVDRVEQLRRRERRRSESGKQPLLQLLDVAGDSLRRQAVLEQHPLDGVEPIQRRWIEGRAEEAPSVLCIADAARRKAEVFEFRVPAGDPRPLAEAGRSVHEGAALARHRIFVTA